MITGTSASDMMRSDVIEVEKRGSTYTGLQQADFATALTDAVKGFKVFGPTVLTASPVTVPADYMGLTVENCGTGTGTSPMPTATTPTVTYGIHRCLGQGTYWAEIETVDGVFNWTKLDAAVALAIAAGKHVMLCLAYTPTIYASNINAHRSSGQAASGGWAAAPADLAGSLQAYPLINSVKWSRFVRAVARRYVGRIKFYSLGNELNYRRYNVSGVQEVPHGNWFDTSDTGVLTDLTTIRTSVSGNQNYTQHVQLEADAFAIIHEEDPAAVVLAPDFFGEASSQSTGGKQAGVTCFAAWLAAGGAAYCDAYAYHGYMDEFYGIEGVSKRWVAQMDALEAARVSAGAAVKPWYNTETGHEQLANMSLDDQKLWVGRCALIGAAKGWKCWVMYAWDSLNSATTQMSLYGTGGVRLIALEFDRWARILQGATITYAAILNNGKVCCTVNGTVYIV